MGELALGPHRTGCGRNSSGEVKVITKVKVISPRSRSPNVPCLCSSWGGLGLGPQKIECGKTAQGQGYQQGRGHVFKVKVISPRCGKNNRDRVKVNHKHQGHTAIDTKFKVITKVRVMSPMLRSYDQDVAKSIEVRLRSYQQGCGSPAHQFGSTLCSSRGRLCLSMWCLSFFKKKPLESVEISHSYYWGHANIWLLPKSSCIFCYWLGEVHFLHKSLKSDFSLSGSTWTERGCVPFVWWMRSLTTHTSIREMQPSWYTRHWQTSVTLHSPKVNSSIYRFEYTCTRVTQPSWLATLTQVNSYCIALVSLYVL